MIASIILLFLSIFFLAFLLEAIEATINTMRDVTIKVIDMKVETMLDKDVDMLSEVSCCLISSSVTIVVLNLLSNFFVRFPACDKDKDDSTRIQIIRNPVKTFLSFMFSVLL